MWMAVSDRGHVLSVATGIQNDRLIFVAITGDAKDSETLTTSIVTGGGAAGDNWHSINYPDGSKQRLPKRGIQLFQYIDGEWAESSGDVTPDEYEEFLASNPEKFTIQSLKEFVKRSRQNAR